MSKILTVITTTYHAEKYLHLYFKGILDLQGLDYFLFLLVMNEPSEEEKRLADFHQSQHPDLFQIIEIPKRETIGASLNRGFALVNTPYCSILDVDDIRVPDSFLRQIVTLEQNPDVDFTYGDFIQVDQMGKKEGVYEHRLEYDLVEFQRNNWTCPSQLFRTTILKTIGGFDEQFTSAGDLEFQIRVAFRFKFKKTPSALLYYTRYRNSNSASGSIFGRIEATAAYLRYGHYKEILSQQKKLYRFVSQARQYRVNDVKINGVWNPLKNFLPEGYEIQQPPKNFEIHWRLRRFAFQTSPRNFYYKYFHSILRKLISLILGWN
jgi:glycosyltransferase involved in cell wall biosynthesis